MNWRQMLDRLWSEPLEQLHSLREGSEGLSTRALFVLVWTTLGLLLLWYTTNDGSRLVRALSWLFPSHRSSFEAWHHVVWSLGCGWVYASMGALGVWWGSRLGPEKQGFVQGLRDAGIGLSRNHAQIYLWLYLWVLPALIAASYTEAFQQTYPLASGVGQSGQRWAMWWLAYGLQFACLEFFFRGFVLAGLRPALGAYAVFISAMPYCMMHFGKPFLEASGALIAGVVLGILALRSGSIWGGVGLHIAVAFTMDILSLWQRGEWSLF